MLELDSLQKQPEAELTRELAGKELFRFSFDGEPIPAMRPRVTRNGTFTPLAYRQYKNRLALALRHGFGHLVSIPASGDKARSSYLKSYRYRLKITAYRSNNRPVDADNLSKSVLDALQDAGILANDSQVDELFCRKCVDTTSPRIEIYLERLLHD
jgi:Holliday junction resolvase RusA-like endonuclease